MSTPSVIIMPKFVAITPSPLTKPTCKLNIEIDKNERSPSPSSSGYASDGATVKTRKRRLDHLTWEEKVQRKKLKNRVAAQTSRDRKKARMEEMEHEINELTEQTTILQNKCDSLETINNSLLEKNEKLELEVERLRQQLSEIKNYQQKQVICSNCTALNLNGSAVSNTDPLQQGSQNKVGQTAQIAALWKIITLCLLYKTCSSTMNSLTLKQKTLMPISLKNWQRACLPISQQTWKQAIKRATTLLPKMQAARSDCLDQWWGPQQNAWNPTDIKIIPQQNVKQ